MAFDDYYNPTGGSLNSSPPMTSSDVTPQAETGGGDWLGWANVGAEVFGAGVDFLGNVVGGQQQANASALAAAEAQKEREAKRQLLTMGLMGAAALVVVVVLVKRKKG